MCGRYTLRTPAAKLIRLFDVSSLPELAPRYNIAPTQRVLCVRAVTEGGGSREAVLMRWGLVPFWAKDLAIGNKMINARSETVAEKPAFRNAFAKRRCLVVADGFYEWQKLESGKKQPWLMEMPEQQPFAMAGLWEIWTPPQSEHATSNEDDSEHAEEPVVTCSILTTEANADMRVLHDRMPVIVPIESWAAWLSPQASPGQLKDLCRPLDDGLLQKREVSPAINRPIEPKEPGDLQLHSEA
jgi:putative SOS response-associated peptidase YedK